MDIGFYVGMIVWPHTQRLMQDPCPLSLRRQLRSGSGKLRLVSFIQDDYPNNWQDETEVDDDTWYHVTAPRPHELEST